ncbi:MAG: hypothetical protein R3B06_00695 [Kofleriaceae bacterium]
MLKHLAPSSLLALVGTIAGSASSAAAEPAVAITMSPIHLVVPMGEVTVEARVAPRVGVAAIVGIGGIRDRSTDALIHLYEGGASVRYYVTGSFRGGVQVGGEALYVHADASSTTTSVAAAGLGLSPFVGYKWTHRSGFTLDAQGGVTYLTLRAEDTAGTTASARQVGAMLNLNLGYSF